MTKNEETITKVALMKELRDKMTKEIKGILDTSDTMEFDNLKKAEVLSELFCSTILNATMLAKQG